MKPSLQPAPPAEGPSPSDQVNLTDEESRIMPVSGGGFEQCYNAQAAVAEGSLLVVASGVTQAPNDKRELEPMLSPSSLSDWVCGARRDSGAATSGQA